MAVAISWRVVQTLTWLVFAIVCLFFALVFWVAEMKQPSVEIIEPEKQAQEAVRPVTVAAIGLDDQLGAFGEEVPVIVLQKRVIASGDRAPEFRGSKFVDEHQESWALQVMQVTEEEVIKSYLDQTENRSKYQYFRIQKPGEREQFILTYGIFKDVKSALDETKGINFDLPVNVQMKPEKFSSYANGVNDLGYDEMSTGTKLRPITLTRAPLPIIPDIRTRQSAPSSNYTEPSHQAVTNNTQQRPQAEKPPTTSTNNTTTVAPQPSTVEKKPSSANTTSEFQVVDPFN